MYVDDMLSPHFFVFFPPPPPPPPPCCAMSGGTDPECWRRRRRRGTEHGDKKAAVGGGGSDALQVGRVDCQSNARSLTKKLVWLREFISLLLLNCPAPSASCLAEQASLFVHRCAERGEGVTWGGWGIGGRRAVMECDGWG